MNKIGLLTYLSNDKESLIVAADDIEGGNGLIMDIIYILDLWQIVKKSVKCWCGDNEILNTVTPQVFMPSHQYCQQKVERA